MKISNSKLAWIVGLLLVVSLGLSRVPFTDTYKIVNKTDTQTQIQEVEHDLGTGQYAPEVWSLAPNIDTTNNVAKVATKIALGSGGLISSSGILHTGPCNVARIWLSTTNGSAQTFTIWDNTTNSGTQILGTITIPANSDRMIDMGGLTCAVGLYATLGTNCQAVAYVYPSLN